MSEKQFVVKELEILNEENEWKGEYWWAVVNTKRVEDCFECRNKEVALELCDFLNKATDDFKWQINRCEKWSAKCKQLDKEIDEQQATITHLEKVFGENFAKRRLLEQDNLILRNENEQLRKRCLELEKDYVIETSDISDRIYLDDEIRELEQKYGVEDE